MAYLKRISCPHIDTHTHTATHSVAQHSRDLKSELKFLQVAFCLIALEAVVVVSLYLLVVSEKLLSYHLMYICVYL